MALLRVSVVGQDLFKIVEEKFELAGFNTANQVKTGMLGNLKILAYTFELEDQEIIEKRKKLMQVMSEDYLRLMPMFVNGDWMRIFVFKPIHI